MKLLFASLVLLLGLIGCTSQSEGMHLSEVHPPASRPDNLPIKNALIDREKTIKEERPLEKLQHCIENDVYTFWDNTQTPKELSTFIMNDCFESFAQQPNLNKKQLSILRSRLNKAVTSEIIFLREKKQANIYNQCIKNYLLTADDGLTSASELASTFISSCLKEANLAPKARRELLTNSEKEKVTLAILRLRKIEKDYSAERQNLDTKAIVESLIINNQLELNRTMQDLLRSRWRR